MVTKYCLAALLLAATLFIAAKPVFADDSNPPTSVYDFTVTSIDGTSVPLSTYKGDVLLIVNTASLCGNTPQYKPLEAIYEKYKSKGFRILAFPANNFAHQEPGDNPSIKEFCTGKYHVSFDLFSKISVAGDDQAPRPFDPAQLQIVEPRAFRRLAQLDFGCSAGRSACRCSG